MNDNTQPAVEPNDQPARRVRKPAIRQTNTTPPPAPPAVPTRQEIPKTGAKAMAELLKTKRDAIARVIPPASNLKADNLIQNVLQYVMRDRRLLCCTPYSVLDATLVAASTGLDVIADQAYLIPIEKKRKDDRGNEQHECWIASFWPSYKGLLTVAARAGFSLDVQEVREGDVIEIAAGTENRIIHKIPFSQRGGVIGVYCVVRNANNQVTHIERMDNTDLDAVRKNTEPWKAFFGEMSRKSVAKRAYKWLPKDNPQVRLLAEVDKRIDEEQDMSDLVSVTNDCTDSDQAE
jgi:phage RecT family recombinase